MGVKETVNETGTFVPYDHLASRAKLLETISVHLEQDPEDLETYGSASGIKTNPVVNTRLSRRQRVFNWFGEKVGRSRIFRAGAFSAVMLALISCSSTYTPNSYAMQPQRHNIPCRYRDSLPKIENSGIWVCEEFGNSCSCVPVARRALDSFYGP